jgi:hypothetical protein
MKQPKPKKSTGSFGVLPKGIKPKKSTGSFGVLPKGIKPTKSKPGVSLYSSKKK